MAERAFTQTEISGCGSKKENFDVYTYDPRFDIDAYNKLRNTRGEINSEEWGRRLGQLDLRTTHNLETNLGERFDVELSQVTYTLVDGHLVSGEHDEKFIDVIERGVIYRREHGNPADFLREQAVLAGFGELERLFMDESVENILLVSPRGDADSEYQKNFFDLYTREGNKVLASRFSSGFSREKFWETTKKLSGLGNVAPFELSDSFFLSNPVIVEGSREEVLSVMHSKKGTVDLGGYVELKRKSSALISEYKKSLREGKGEKIIFENYNAILNYADDIVLGNEQFSRSKTYLPDLEMPAWYLIEKYGLRPVREVRTGCGRQIGFGVSTDVNSSIFSVADYGVSGEDSYGTREINCEKCGAKYMRDSGKLEEKCKKCGGKKGIAC